MHGPGQVGGRHFCSGGAGLKAVAQRHSVNVASLRQRIAGYRAHGEAGVRTKKQVPPNFLAGFKLSVLKRMREQGVSQRQTAALFNIRRFNVIGEREEKFNHGGSNALGRVHSECRKTMSKASSVHANQPNSDYDRSRQVLIDELKSLCMESAYLKSSRPGFGRRLLWQVGERAVLLEELAVCHA